MKALSFIKFIRVLQRVIGKVFPRRDFLAAAAASALLPSAALAYHREDNLEEFEPQVVRLKAKFNPGEIHVDPNTYRLYLTQEKGQAIRYTVGVGRLKLYEPGTFYVGRKAEWPSWRPTDAMIEREPETYLKFADGIPGGPENPLGARALYLYYPDTRRDSYLRIHGTTAPYTIGHAVSNGCARLVNEHIIDLYNRVPVGTKVVLHPRQFVDDVTS